MFLSRRTRRLLVNDLARLPARLVGWRRAQPSSDKLHLGSGSRHVAGWLNVDIRNSEQNVDLASGRLPWPDAAFQAVVSQHVIEHLELFDELIPLLRELHRVVKPSGELWLSCPDLEKVCSAYLTDRARALTLDREQRFPGMGLPEGVPTQHFVNLLFHQGGEHQNLFDFELLSWALNRAGFGDVTRVDETALLHRFPEFPKRNDDLQSLYVRAQTEPLRVDR